MEIILFLIFVIFAAFFAASETAFFSLHASAIRLMKKKKSFNAQLIETLKKDSEKLLTTILIGSTVVNLGAGAYTTEVATGRFGSLGIGIIAGLTTIIILLVGEIIPKSFAYNNNVKVAQYFAYPLYFFVLVFTPVTFVLNAINKKLSNGHNKHHGHISEDEVLIMSRMSVEKGGIGYDEHQLIERIFKFNDIKVGEIMTAEPRIHFVNGEVKVDQIAHYVSKTEHSRYPVYVGNNNNIVGYIHINTVMKALNSKDRDRPIVDFVSPIQKIDENIQLDRAFRAMNKKQAHMYLVHKHKNPKNIIGLITLEDILEELVGEIEDETDL
ncbi:MAG: CNNM domain-containing protein [Patescibacteria group bacterium]